ncbi:disrupted in renal carcinoma protein 2-like protein [Elysia marginata]|uniref:Disrupted in renal carcinoma protein 2-like protein n=1 Tax=Elysia marginata TaxID=1093978 RepID=A0AAV4GMG4_9GAST|nr:disrupted in renal carcinoma protein 2-like protein [Elysia marginata]
MEKDAAVGKDRLSRSRLSAGGTALAEPPAEQTSLMSVPGATHGDQAFQTVEKVPETETSESGLVQSAVDISSGAPGHQGEILPGDSEVVPPGPFPRGTLAESGTVCRPVNCHNTESQLDLSFTPVVAYEGSTARPPLPRSFPTLPANTTDDAKLVDHYEHTLGLSASSLDRARFDHMSPLNSSQDPPQSQQLPEVASSQNSLITGPEPPSTHPQASLGNSSSGRRTTPSLNSSPLELGLVDQLAELGLPKQEENVRSSPSDIKTLASATSSGGSHSHEGSAEVKAVPGTSGSPLTPADQLENSQEEVSDSQPPQSLKDILANIVLEEQVITIKLHRDPPHPRRSQRRGERLSRSRVGPASGTGVLAPHSEDQITYLSTADRRGRPVTHRAVSNIETRHDIDAFLTQADISYSTPSNSFQDAGQQAVQNGICVDVHPDPSPSSDMRRTTSDGAFSRDDNQPTPGSSRQGRQNITRLTHSGRPKSNPTAANEERMKRFNIVVQRTGRRSAPVFSRRGFGTAEFWNSGQTSINRAILKQIFSRPPSSASGRRSRAADRDRFGRERSLSVGAERRGQRTNRLLSDGNARQDLPGGRASAPLDRGVTSTGKRKKPSRRKMASYGSMEERGPSCNSLVPEADDDGANVMSSRYARERDIWRDETDDLLEEEVFRNGRSPRAHGPGIKGGFGVRSQKRATPRSLAQDPTNYGLVPADAGSIPRPISVQEQETSSEVVPVIASKTRRRGRKSEEDGDKQDASGSESESESSEDDETAALLKDTKTEIYKRRWYLLFLFSMMALIWNAIWSTWGPIAQSAKQVYSWGDGDIAMFTWLGNLPFLVTMFPIAYLMDVKGEKMTLTSQKDLDFIRDIAENRDEWRTFIAEIRRGAAEALRSDDPISERL